MELAPGDRLGPYEITAPIGAGGMGQVYKAKDTRLDRTVAIKILPALFAADRQFQERFDREARLISQLDHPNICALHDVGQHNGTSYLVMQYLEGETLEERLQRGALPPDIAVPIAIQIADALARAHAAGIIHRDLKPANIMLTKSGARLLDFGLARGGGAALTTLTETQPARLTGQGMIIGTFHYMAPEQIEGAEGDARTDVWSFGCVLYEMLTGARPFDGRTTASVFANILNAPVAAVRERRPGISRTLDHIVTRCLEKNPDARWQAVADIAHQLRWAAAPDDSAAVAVRPLWNRAAAYVAALLLAAAAFAAAWLLKPVPAASPTAPLLKLAFVPPADMTLTPFGSNGNPQFALSPDGSRIAYVAAQAGRAPALWVQRLDSRTAREIPGSIEATAPFWSRDSQAIAFFSHGRLRRSGLESEQSEVLASTDASGGTWSGDVILVASGFGPVMRLRASGGALTPATTVEAGEAGHRWPQFLPDGKHFIYSQARAGGARIAALDSMDSAVLLESGSTPVVADATNLLFVPRARKLQAQPIDAASRLVSGAPRDVLEGVRYVAGSGFPPASVSATGLLAYWDGTTVATALRWYDRAGNVIANVPAPDDPPYFVISPDGRQLAYLLRAPEGVAVWLMDLLSGVASRLTLSGSGARPIWSRDSSTLSLTAAGKTGIALLRRSIHGGGERVLGEVPIPDRGNAAPGNFYANDWSGDGQTALVSVTQPDTGRDIVVFSTATGRTTPFVNAKHSQVQPRFSPDERWVAYSSNETGPWEVFVEAFPVAGVRHQVSNAGGAQPLWRRDGKELFFVARDGTLMQVDVTPGNRWVPATPRALFPSRMRPLFAPYPYTYDVSADGQRFLLSEVLPGTGPVVSIVTDWRQTGAR
jgi:serine/threonine protein kinase